jgi:hypothetical protein
MDRVDQVDLGAAGELELADLLLCRVCRVYKPRPEFPLFREGRPRDMCCACVASARCARRDERRRGQADSQAASEVEQQARVKAEAARIEAARRAGAWSRASADRLDGAAIAAAALRPVSLADSLAGPWGDGAELDLKLVGALERAGILTVGDLLDTRRERLEAIPQIGPRQVGCLLELARATRDGVGFVE